MAPKKAAKKAAKKVAGKHDPNKQAKDARRTFEHLGRVQAMSSLTSAEADALQLLTETADAAYRAQQYKESADLLRTAEHLSFAFLHAGANESVSADLERAIREEFDHLIERSFEHSSHHEIPKLLTTLHARLTRDAKAALTRSAFRSALEFARGAEALSHVHGLDSRALPSPAPKKALRA